MGDSAELGFIRLNWRGARGPRLTALKNAICGELTDEEFVPALNASQPDEVFWQTDPEWDHRAGKDTWGHVPRSFLRLTEDRAMPLAAQDLYLAEADALTPGNRFEVHSVKSSHAGFLRSPEAVVDILTRLTPPITRS